MSEDGASRMARIEAEMAKFEEEMSSMAGSSGASALQFLPQQCRPPPMPLPFPPMPPAPRPPAPAGPVISAAPQPYLPHGVKTAAASGVRPPQPLDKVLKAKGDTGAGVSLTPHMAAMQSAVLAKDMAAVEAKRQNDVAFQNSYLGQVVAGKAKMKKFLRASGGTVWEDSTLAEWDPADYRLFVGNLGNEVSDELLAKAFRKYASFQRSKVVREKRTNKSKGFGFVSFKNPEDFTKAMREMDGKYLGNRPVRLRRSNWKERSLDVVKKKEKHKQRLGIK